MLLHACRCGPRGGGSRHLLDARPHRARRAGRTSDPTGTLPLQHRFTRAFDARWAQLKKMIPNAVGRTTDPVGMIHHSAMMGDDPVRAFQAWIDEAMRQLLLGINGSWTLSYVRAAGDVALLRASGLSAFEDVPADRVPQLQTLTITELQGIMEAVSQQAVRAFANGLLIKQSSSKIARDTAQVIESVGKRRTQLLVSFIVVRTFSAVTLDAFRAAGFSSVGTVAERVRSSPRLPDDLTRDAPDEDLVEVLTAGDDLVCEECQDISDEGPYDLDYAEMLIPAHPRCRCAFVPWGDRRFASVRDEVVEEFVEDAFNPDQPRDKSGKWTSTGSTEALANLKGYLTQVAAMRGASTGAHARASVEQFVLDHGKAYTFDKSSFEGPRDQIKLCYQNAGRIAMNDSSRTYVEGFISYRGIPIQHAWTVDKNNKVHDTTLRDGEGVGAYYGVPFKQEYVIKTAMKTKVWGILHHTNPSLFKEKDPRKFVKDYDPNQERDDHGRWSLGGGSGHHYSDTPSQDLLALHHSGEETMADVERQLTPGQKFAAKEAEAALAGRKPTNVEFIDPKTGAYTPERAVLHAEILNNMFSKEDIAHAIPAPGQKPTLIITGGRPAAGKTSTLKGELAGADKHSFYISADTIQEYLPHYEGKMAGLFNGEAQDIALQAEGIARKNGLNITYDATLKSQQPAIDRVQTYKDAGYDVHGYFVHTAPITSAVRSAHRFMDSGRYVPPAVSFNSRTNEKTFDALIPMLDKWAIYDNNGEKPKLIARGKKP